MTKHFLITGVTGEVAAPLAQALLARGHQVTAIARSQGALSARARVQAATGCSAINVLEGNIQEKLCGLAEHSQGYDAFVHAAALTKFDKVLEPTIMQTNVQGTQHALELAQHLAIPDFHYISTAYVVGAGEKAQQQGIFYEQAIGTEARNPYEASKQRAEAKVRAWQLKTAGQAAKHYIHRLSVVVGDSRTGESQHYKSFYGYIKTFWQLQARLQPLSQEAPFLLRINPEATLNLIPIDWLTQMLVALLEQPIASATYHLTHPQARSFAWLMQHAFYKLGIAARFVDPLEEAEAIFGKHSPAWHKAQRMIDRMLLRYAPYVQLEPSFDNRQLRHALGEHYRAAPEISPELIGRLMDYAIADNFGIA